MIGFVRLIEIGLPCLTILGLGTMAIIAWIYR